MLRKKISSVGNSAAIVLSRDVLRLMDLEIGDEVELSVLDQALIVRSTQEVERSERVRRAADRVITQRKGLLARLAEGPGSLSKTPARRRTPAK
jgi:antitoxin component of MazEF toxin-antitoxin module